MTAFARVYQGPARTTALANVQVRAAVINAAGTEAAASTSTLEASGFSAGRSADYSIPIPVSMLPPGQYVLSVTASIGDRTAGRAMRFEIRPAGEQ